MKKKVNLKCIDKNLMVEIRNIKKGHKENICSIIYKTENDEEKSETTDEERDGGDAEREGREVVAEGGETAESRTPLSRIASPSIHQTLKNVTNS